MPSEEELPVSLRKLAYRNGIQIRPDPDFHQDMNRLIFCLKKICLICEQKSTFSFVIF